MASCMPSRKTSISSRNPWGAVRKPELLLSLMALVVVGYVASALAWSYPSLLAARFISGLPHGAWYGVAGLAAAQRVPQSKRTRYIGYVMVGLAAANVAGVPAMTWLGQQQGRSFAR